MHISPLRTVASAPSAQGPRFKGVFATYEEAEKAPDYDPEKDVDSVEFNGNRAYLTGKEQAERRKLSNEKMPLSHFRYNARVMTWVNQAHPQPSLWDKLFGKE